MTAAPNGRVQDALHAAGIDHQVHDHAELGNIKSPDDFARALGITLDQITKSLFLRDTDGEYAVLVAPMSDRIDFKALREETGRKFEVAAPSELEAIVGYPRNGVSPFGLPGNVSVFVDERVLEQSVVTVGAGVAGVEVALDPREIVRATEATITRSTRARVLQDERDVAR